MMLAPLMSARCPVCYRPLRLWPASRGPIEFNCCSKRLCRDLAPDGRTKKPCHNDGSTDVRFNCYNCDIDYCGECAKAEQLAKLAHEHQHHEDLDEERVFFYDEDVRATAGTRDKLQQHLIWQNHKNGKILSAKNRVFNLEDDSQENLNDSADTIILKDLSSRNNHIEDGKY